MTDLEQTCRLLYGERWKPEAARKLGCSERALRYYASGERQVPEEITNKLKKQVAAHKSRLGEIARLLRK